MAGNHVLEMLTSAT